MLLLPILLGGAAAAGLYFLWKWLRRKIEQEQEQEHSGGGSDHGENGSSLSRGERDGRQQEEQRKRSNLIDAIVKAVQFSTQELVSDKHLRGTRPRHSIVPNANYTVRPMQNVCEMTSLLPQSQMMDDDQFYAQLAANKLLVGEFIEYHGKARNTLIVAVDGSGSMDEYSRAAWANGLCERLIERCLRVGAEMFLIIFSAEVRGLYHIHDKKSAEDLRQKLGYVLSPGGSTDVNNALKKIFEIVEKGKFSESRALLVTDGTEGIDEKKVLGELKRLKISLHTVCIAGERDDLKRVSRQYDRLGMYS